MLQMLYYFEICYSIPAYSILPSVISSRSNPIKMLHFSSNKCSSSLVLAENFWSADLIER